MENKETNSQPYYIKVDKNLIINERCIRWVVKMNECLEICTRSNSCVPLSSTHRVCRLDNPETYDRLNKHFE